jgi:SAM-dependent methyltransferase
MHPKLKRLILAIYNPVALRTKHYYKWACTALTEPWTGCPVCGRKGPKRFVPEVVAGELAEMWGLSPETAQGLRVKESMTCPWCGSKYRARRLAEVMLKETCLNPRRFESIRAFANSGLRLEKPILILNWIDGISDMLQQNPSVIQTEFVEGISPGAFQNGIRHEDAQSLSFADASFSLVLSSETLEHIPDLDKALGEIHRVLEPGGAHLFTIPLKPGVGRTEPRARLTADGVVTDLILPRLHHPGGSRGWPVFMEFGADLPELLEQMGMTVIVDNHEPALLCPVFRAVRGQRPDQLPARV